MESTCIQASRCPELIYVAAQGSKPWVCAHTILQGLVWLEMGGEQSRALTHTQPFGSRYAHIQRTHTPRNTIAHSHPAHAHARARAWLWAPMDANLCNLCEHDAPFRWRKSATTPRLCRGTYFLSCIICFYLFVLWWSCTDSTKCWKESSEIWGHAGMAASRQRWRVGLRSGGAGGGLSTLTRFCGRDSSL